MLQARLQGSVKAVAGLRVLGCLLACLLGLGGPAKAVGPADAEAARVARERAAIVAERDRVEARFAAELAACSERFAVTACQDDVRARRRGALEGPRARALALDDTERRSRSAARREAVAQKQRRAAERPPPAVAAASAPAAAVQPTPSPAPQRRAATSASPAAASAAAEAAAAQRAAAARQRQAAVKDEQARIAARQAERAQRGKSAATLPVPQRPARARPPAAPSSAAR